MIWNRDVTTFNNFSPSSLAHTRCLRYLADRSADMKWLDKLYGRYQKFRMPCQYVKALGFSTEKVELVGRCCSERASECCTLEKSRSRSMSPVSLDSVMVPCFRLTDCEKRNLKLPKTHSKSRRTSVVRCISALTIYLAPKRGRQPAKNERENLGRFPDHSFFRFWLTQRKELQIQLVNNWLSSIVILTDFVQTK